MEKEGGGGREGEGNNTAQSIAGHQLTDKQLVHYAALTCRCDYGEKRLLCWVAQWGGSREGGGGGK